MAKSKSSSNSALAAFSRSFKNRSEARSYVAAKKRRKKPSRSISDMRQRKKDIDTIEKYEKNGPY